MDNNSNINDGEEVFVLLDENGDVIAEDVPVEEMPEAGYEEPIAEAEPEYESEEPEAAEGEAYDEAEEGATEEYAEEPEASLEDELGPEVEYEEEPVLENPDIEYDDDEEEKPVLGGVVNKILTVAAIILVIIAVVLGISLMKGKKSEVETVDFSTVGSQMAGITVIGGDNIEAITAAQGARLDELYEAVKSYDYDEADEETGITDIDITLTTIVKDLKIKVVNKKNKLIANVPFQVEVTDPNGKTTTWTDTDKDGIIYQTDLAGGIYTVKLVALDGYDTMYNFENAEKQSITVLSQLEYKKVDVSNEIKTASQVDVATEDTAEQDTTVESSNKDTVTYVMSAKTADGNGYEEVDRSTLTSPVETLTVKYEVSSFRFKRLSSGPVNLEDVSDGGTPTEHTHTYSWDGNTGSGGSHTLKCTVTDCTETQTESCSDTKNNSTSADGADGYCDVCGAAMSYTASLTITGTDKLTVGLDTDIEISATAEIPSYMSVSTYSWTIEGDCVSTDENLNGAAVTISAVKAGTANITCVATLNDNSTVRNTLQVTVTAPVLNYSTTKVAIIDGDVLKFTVVKADGTAIDESLINWTSSDTAIATVSKGEITPITTGTVTIKVVNKATETVMVSTTVVVLDPKNDDSSKLLDTEGNQLYVKNSSGEYVEATYKDYYDDTVKLYKSVGISYKYTGWWTIDGKTYYFDANGNKVTGNQVILGAKYTFSSDGVLQSGTGSFGIDVSTWQGTIDWSKVAKSGVSFAIIRCGYRGSTVGGLVADSKFETNIKNATAAGIKVGVYFFTQAITEAEAVEEASMVLGQVADYTISYPIFIDVESASNGRANGLTKAERTAIVKAFCKTITNSGYKAGVYANKNWFTNYINTSELTEYTIWLAQYASAPTYTLTRYDLWQYSSQGSISGISGNVDLDLSYLSY